VHVVYGLVGLKTHAKVVLVVRDDAEGLRRYCHVGTGNYNSHTARTYEDLGLFTADPTIGNDLIDLFNFLTGFSHEPHFRRLLVAPHELRDAVVGLIDGERRAAGRSRGQGRIVMKMNSLVDPVVIGALEVASQAGVEIDLLVRGICCLVPGVPGCSERIRVRSLVGRFLEHSRLYHFANGEGDGRPAWYLGSADMMPRNLDRRVEVLVPVLDEGLRARLREIVDIELADTVLAWELSRKGQWRRVARAPAAGRRGAGGGGEQGKASDDQPTDAQERLSVLEAARARSR
jgi:polyphosphate kinase